MNQKLTVCSIAGYCSVTTLWKIILDLSSELLDKKSEYNKVLISNTVEIDGEDFHIADDNSKELVTEFNPPERLEEFNEAALVWSLGALVCYASSGHYVFGGRGGFYQAEHPDVELPVLRKDHSSITPLVQRCLCYSPNQRISLKELNDLALRGYEEAKTTRRIETQQANSEDLAPSNEPLDYVWPEKMDY